VTGLAVTEAPTPLAARLARLIEGTGPMTVASYMAACLSDPEHGYYQHRDPLGRAGDFITAPEISQLFGELIGVWCVATWQAMGEPGSFILAELGPGRGTLMADLLRAARVRPRFTEAARVHLVETSPRLRAIQAETLGRSGGTPTWHDTVAGLPDGPLILVANEFFDALPIRQFVRTKEGWAERVVGLGADRRLAFGLMPGASLPELPPGVAPGTVWETGAAATALAAEIGTRLAATPSAGAALIVDYGYATSPPGPTLQAVRGHAHDDPLAHPGEADLSAHVDFAALAEAAEAAGTHAAPLLTQADFLARLGLAERAERLARARDAATARTIRSGADRLTRPDGMGDLFKVLGLGARGLNLPVFDTR
jgi:NADH dehydrogenase [ubiquinone] 1 alpha subcomplex assembly factor 7